MRRSPPLGLGEVAEPHRIAGIGQSSGVVSGLECQLALAQALGDVGVWHYDVGAESMSWSDQMYRILEVPAGRPVTMAFLISLLALPGREKLHNWSARAGTHRIGFDETLRFRTPQGKLGWIRMIAGCQPAASGPPGLTGAVKLEPRGNDRQEIRLSRDSLTGLPNRQQFLSSVRDLASTHDQASPFALLLFSVDDLRIINERDGERSGDDVLQQIARALETAAGVGDILARISGDEFAVIARGLETEEQAASRVARTLELVGTRSTSRPGGPRISVTAAISLFPQDGRSAEGLLKRATAALQAAKASGRNQTDPYRRDLLDGIENRRLVHAKLRVAIAEQQLEVFYQPIIDLRTSIVHGWEALLRWNHPTRGLLTPGLFLVDLDDSVLAIEIHNFVLEQALAQMRSWLDTGVPVTCVSVNASEHQLRRDDFIEDLMALLLKYRLGAERLKIEVLETIFFGSRIDEVAETISRLNALGVVCALDDFGTGFATLTHLKQFKVERIKIDQSFIQNIDTDPFDKAITRSMVDLGRDLGIRVTAEGIETLDQLRIVRDLGCDCAQGYLFGHPMPAGDVPAALQSWTERGATAILG